MVGLLVLLAYTACQRTKTCTPNYDMTITDLHLDNNVYPVDKVFYGKEPALRARSFHSEMTKEDLMSLIHDLGFKDLEEIPKTVYCFLSCDMDGELSFSNSELIAVSLFFFRNDNFYNELYEYKEGIFNLVDIKEWPTSYIIRSVENNYMEFFPAHGCKTFYGISRPFDSK